jgi:hypothetical protein
VQSFYLFVSMLFPSFSIALSFSLLHSTSPSASYANEIIPTSTTTATATTTSSSSSAPITLTAGLAHFDRAWAAPLHHAGFAALRASIQHSLYQVCVRSW